MIDANVPHIALSPDARETLDRYLDQIDEALRQNGDNRSDRLAVCEEIESQVLETLIDRCDSGVDRSDVESVLAELDAPDAYRTIDHPNAQAAYALPPDGATTSNPSWFAIVAFVIPILSVILVLVANITEGEAITTITLAQALAILIVWIGRESIRQSSLKADRRFAIAGLCMLPTVALLGWTVWTVGDRFEAAAAPVREASEAVRSWRQEQRADVENIRRAESRLYDARRSQAEFDQGSEPFTSMEILSERVQKAEEKLVELRAVLEENSKISLEKSKYLQSAQLTLWWRYPLATALSLIQLTVVVAVCSGLARLSERWLSKNAHTVNG